jgi:2-keto-4-pentenoate hydratase/2-oxohepta-3-ene-1,7-dioic acid hydratase in catechol pathway
MKLASYIKADRASYGAVFDGGIVDLGFVMGDRYPDLKSLLGGGLEEAAVYVKDKSVDTSLDEVRLLPVIPNPGVVWAAGMNTHSHYVEAKDAMGLSEVTKVPMFFLRATNTLVASGEALEKPLKEPGFDYEGEIALIVGKRCRNVSVEQAPDHIAGFAPFNDGSARFYQVSSNQVTTGKNAYRSGGFGPWMATADSIDMHALEMITRVNDEPRQHMHIDDLIFSFAQLISHISEVNWLEPGDVIVTGSPEGAGALRQPRVFLAAGDRVEVEVPGIATLVNTVRDQVID